MARRAIVGAVLVLHAELVVEYESDEQLQAAIVERLQGDGQNGWDRSKFRQSGAWVQIAEVRRPDAPELGMGFTLPEQRQAS